MDLSTRRIICRLAEMMLSEIPVAGDLSFWNYWLMGPYDKPCRMELFLALWPTTPEDYRMLSVAPGPNRFTEPDKLKTRIQELEVPEIAQARYCQLIRKIPNWKPDWNVLEAEEKRSRILALSMISFAYDIPLAFVVFGTAVENGAENAYLYANPYLPPSEALKLFKSEKVEPVIYDDQGPA